MTPNEMGPLSLRSSSQLKVANRLVVESSRFEKGLIQFLCFQILNSSQEIGPVLREFRIQRIRQIRETRTPFHGIRWAGSSFVFCLFVFLPFCLSLSLSLSANPRNRPPLYGISNKVGWLLPQPKENFQFSRKSNVSGFL